MTENEAVLEDQAKTRGPATTPPASGTRERVLPGRPVLPAPGAPEPPRPSKRVLTSSFWPAPPERPRVPPARPSKRGSPLTTTSLGFPVSDPPASKPPSSLAPTALAPASAAPARAPAPAPTAAAVVSAPVAIPQAPRSKRTFTEHGWPSAPHPIEAAAEAEVEAEIELELSVEIEEAPVALAEVAAPPAVEETALAPVFAPLAEAPSPAHEIPPPALVFADDDSEIDLPVRRIAPQLRWIVLMVLAAGLAIVAVAVFAP